ncbi:MAG TPA: hypothetical protein VHH11_14080 [Gammaproteobacteria bacterium]|nr:hypothetical protein [Gammaproteobacteria bacterium]
MVWQAISVAGNVTQWAQPEASAGWFCRLQDLTRPTRVADLDRASSAAQFDALNEALAAASNAYRAITLPARADPVWHVEQRNFFASLGAARRAMAHGAAGRPLNAAGAAGVARNATTDFGPLYAWATLDDASLPSYWCSASPEVPAMAKRVACAPADWNQLSEVPGFGWMMPPRWVMEFLYRVAVQSVQRGPVAIIQQATGYSIGQNLRLAQALGVQGIDEMYAAVAAYNARLVANPAAAGLATGLGLAAAAANAVPVAGQVASAILGVASALSALFTQRGLTRQEQLQWVPLHVAGADSLGISPDFSVPPAPGNTACAADVLPGPRVLATMDPRGALHLTLTGAPPGMRGAVFEVRTADGVPLYQGAPDPDLGGWRFERDPGTTQDGDTHGEATFTGLVPSDRYLARAEVHVGPDTIVYTPLVLTGAVPPPLDVPATLRALGLTCAAWQTLPRAERLGRLQRLQTLGQLDEHVDRAAAITSIESFCFQQLARGTTTPPTVSPGPRPSPDASRSTTTTSTTTVVSATGVAVVLAWIASKLLRH